MNGSQQSLKLFLICTLLACLKLKLKKHKLVHFYSRYVMLLKVLCNDFPFLANSWGGMGYDRLEEQALYLNTMYLPKIFFHKM